MEAILKAAGIGRRPVDDPFFEESYEVCKVFQRKGITVEDDEESFHEILKKFPCTAKDCKSVFQTLVDFEIHYNSCHRYVCAECRKSRPNPRLLEIHIQETHDSFFEAASLSKPMYQCYVSECDLKFNNSNERKQHCRDVHKFPKNFRFDDAPKDKEKTDPANKMEVDGVVEKPRKTKSKKVLLNKNQKVKMFILSKKISPTTSVDNNDTNVTDPVPENVSVSSALMFVPRQVQKSYSKALTKGQKAERNVLETETMMDLAESLPS